MRHSRARSGRIASLLALALSAGACSLAVSSFADRGFEPQRYRTFAWGPPDAFSTGDPRLDHNEFFAARVQRQIERELASRGFAKTASAPPDLLVHYHASVAQEIDVRTLDGGDRSYGEAAEETYVYDAGTLFIDLVEPGTNRLLWRGWAEGSVAGVIDDQDYLEKRIDEAVARILRRLPRRS